MLELLPLLDAESCDSAVCDPPYELGFMGRKWDSSGIAFRKETWAEVLRVLKPGGYLLAFGGSRTAHRIACAIEDAGFEIREIHVGKRNETDMVVTSGLREGETIYLENPIEAAKRAKKL